MKSIVPVVVRAVSFLGAAGITALLLFVHAADTSLLGAHDVVVAEAFAMASAAVSEPHVGRAR
ncbi:MAG TPA: hypothetical protein VGI14_12785 [Casimicrobiaceae bacterium]|jgi:hypothetical protein